MNIRGLMVCGLVVSLALTACAGQSTAQPAATSDQPVASPVRGKIVDLVEVPQEGSDVPSVESFTLSTGDKELTFKIGDALDRNIWNTLHFRSHLQFGEPVGVTFEETSEGLVAVMLTE